MTLSAHSIYKSSTLAAQNCFAEKGLNNLPASKLIAVVARAMPREAKVFSQFHQGDLVA